MLLAKQIQLIILIFFYFDFIPIFHLMEVKWSDFSQQSLFLYFCPLVFVLIITQQQRFIVLIRLLRLDYVFMNYFLVIDLEANDFFKLIIEFLDFKLSNGHFLVVKLIIFECVGWMRVVSFI